MRGRRRRAGRKLPRDDHMKGHAISRRFSPRSAIRLVGAKRFSCPLGTNCGCSSPDVSLEYVQVLNFDWGKSSFSTNKAKVEEEKLEEDTLTLELESMGAWNASEKFSIQFANDVKEQYRDAAREKAVSSRRKWRQFCTSDRTTHLSLLQSAASLLLPANLILNASSVASASGSVGGRKAGCCYCHCRWKGAIFERD